MSDSDSDFDFYPESFGDSDNSNSSSETNATEVSFLKFLQEQNTADTQEAKRWRTQRQQGGRFFNDLPIHPFLKEHVKRLFTLLSETSENEFTDAFHGWMIETLPLFNDLITEQGEVRAEYLDLDSELATNNPTELLNAFNLMIGEVISLHQETDDTIKYVVLSLNSGGNDEAEYHIMSLKQFFTVACMNNINLERIESKGEGNATKVSFTFSKRNDQINFTKDTEALYNAAKSAMQKGIHMAKKIKPNPPHTTVAELILANTDNLKNCGYDTSTLTSILITSGDTVFKLNSSGPNNDALLADSTELTELANTLLEDTKGLNANIAREGKYKLAGILLGLAGLAIAAVSITLAVATCGISTPLSLLGLHVGVSMIGCGLSVGAAALGLTTCTGLGFFTALKARTDQNNYKKEIANLPNIAERLQLSATLTQLADVAQQRVNPLRN